MNSIFKSIMNIKKKELPMALLMFFDALFPSNPISLRNWFGSELATDMAEYMNSASHLLAPITGIAQAGATLGVTVGGAILGTITTGISLRILSNPINKIRFPLVKHQKDYELFSQLISKNSPADKSKPTPKTQSLSINLSDNPRTPN